MTYRFGILIALIALALGITAAPAAAKTLMIDRGGSTFRATARFKLVSVAR